MVPVSKLFNVKYGVNLELNSLKQSDLGINFVSRTAQNNGVSAKVELIPGLSPIPAGTISVAGGGSVMESFLQPEPYYSGRDLYYLTAKVPLKDEQKLYYCACLRANKYRYNYGRQANRTLKDIQIPSIDEIPGWVNKYSANCFNNVSRPINTKTLDLNTINWRWFLFEDLFEIERGRGPRRKDLDGTGNTPFITSTDKNNGVTGYTKMAACHDGNTIGVNRNGSVGEAFYQPVPFCSTEDVHIFTPKFSGMNVYVGLFLATLIKREKYRYCYGRKWGIDRMKKSLIKLPVTPDGHPDTRFMENYIKQMPFSSQL